MEGNCDLGVEMEMRCEEVQNKLLKYMDHRLVAPEKGIVERHLFYCPDCLFHLSILTAMNPKPEKMPAVKES
jgi:hypothetical protein